MSVKNYKCPKRSLVLLEITAALVFAAAAVVIFIFIPAFSLLFNCVFFPVAALFLFVEAVYFPLYVRLAVFDVGDDFISFCSGVFVNKRRYMKRERVVFVSVVKTPFTPVLKIVLLRIMATGSSIVIPFVDCGDARGIVSVLSPGLD